MRKGRPIEPRVEWLRRHCTVQSPKALLAVLVVMMRAMQLIGQRIESLWRHCTVQTPACPVIVVVMSDESACGPP